VLSASFERIILCVAPKVQGLSPKKMAKKDQPFFSNASTMSESLTCPTLGQLKRLEIGPLNAMLFDVVEMLSADIQAPGLTQKANALGNPLNLRWQPFST
jgi:hypothetical protein